MKLCRLGLCATAFALALSCHANAQDTAQAPASATMASSAMPASSSNRKSDRAADRALRKRVLTALGKDKNLRAAGITVQAHGGAVLLEGWVPESAQIDQATRVAQSVQGVTSVRNTLTLSTF
jgi:hyperosmotically inducible periplasmic protein